ncbi:MAG TPA: dockerin type I domain-containing protein [Pirellulales bacterium]|jgi:probable HAF family extracellular repeat protein
MRKSIVNTLLLGLVVASLPSVGRAAGYYVTDLGADVQPNGINASGEIAGSSNDQAIWYDGTPHYLTGSGGEGLGINDKGQVVGIDLSLGKAFFYDGTTTQTLWNGGAFAINNNGQILGTGNTANRYIPGDGPFIYNVSDGSQQDISSILPSSGYGFALNDTGQVAGYATNNGDWQAYLYDGASLNFLPIFPGEPPAIGINNSGWVVSSKRQSDFDNAVLWDGTSVHGLGNLGGHLTQAYDVNNPGQVVGTSDTIGYGNEHAFLYQGNAMIDLNSVLTENSGWLLTQGTAINDKGQIAGLGTLNGQSHGVLLTPVIPGDVNADGIVNGEDLALMSSTWLQTGSGFAPIPQADANGDGVVNAQDLALASSNWLATPSSGNSAAVPEPSTLILAPLCGIALLACRRSIGRF